VCKTLFCVSPEGVTELFAALEDWEKMLDKQRYLCSDRITVPKGPIIEFNTPQNW
jgi:glutathionyl-hydroquinone reductase